MPVAIGKLIASYGTAYTGFRFRPPPFVLIAAYNFQQTDGQISCAD
jgi:hypothetical protein